MWLLLLLSWCTLLSLPLQMLPMRGVLQWSRILGAMPLLLLVVRLLLVTALLLQVPLLLLMMVVWLSAKCSLQCVLLVLCTPTTSIILCGPTG